MQKILITTLCVLASATSLAQNKNAKPDYNDYVTHLSKTRLALEFSNKAAVATWFCGEEYVKDLAQRVKAKDASPLKKPKTQACVAPGNEFVSVAKEIGRRAEWELKEKGIIEPTKSYYNVTFRFPKTVDKTKSVGAGEGFCLETAQKILDNQVAWPPINGTPSDNSETRCQIERKDSETQSDLLCPPWWVVSKYDFNSNQIELSSVDVKVTPPAEQSYLSRPIRDENDLKEIKARLQEDLNSGVHFVAIVSTKAGSQTGDLEIRGVSGHHWTEGIYNNHQSAWELPAQCSVKVKVDLSSSAVTQGQIYQ